jgi:DUF1680 family protein
MSTMSDSDFWKKRRTINTGTALPYQWKMYEKCGTIDNFRIAAGLIEGQRKGFFYTDSDLHKWADAACRSLTVKKSDSLRKQLKTYIELMERAQEGDGYLFTYNQVWFPGRKWENLLVEHELYCHGHLIEAGVEHAQLGKNSRLLDVARRSADLICRNFMERGPSGVPGHQEIELALVRLYRITGIQRYLDMAKVFLAGRGKTFFPGLRLLGDFRGHEKKAACVARQLGDKDSTGFDYTETTHENDAPNIKLRSNVSFLTGRYQQLHKPIKKQKDPHGHSVRWAYQMTGAVMADRESGTETYLPAVEESWQRLVSRKMYVTGGIGSLPIIEGFGRDYELNDTYAYCETCAAIGNIFLNDELFLATVNSRYPDLLEWQLYNAAGVGIGPDGKSYFYRNPLYSDGTLQRRPWFDTACCPSNVSRLWASVDRYAVQLVSDRVYVNQYITGSFEFRDQNINVKISSGFPLRERWTWR